ncbi:starch synthase [Acetoanaerobium pronyense]|uniref:Glycogen synthase n=1 Tax=Acetoanaerobium pronyense TaxID=1482736 RepID=A0ABS4KIR5_9FIRM|nr:glycogen synthase GlgA [Acetoanaerobium pronyense]MBP2027670.1 starch synthase [Acetoanaerobium pronyense]
MKILFVSSESYPFIKTGGLGDVGFSLPKALRKQGLDVRVMIPKYLQIPEFYKDQTDKIDIFSVPVGWRNQYCGIEKIEYEGVPFYFVDNEYYFKREHPYGYFDDAERFSFFSRAVVEFIKRMDFVPDVIHLNDWHTALIPAYMKIENLNHLENKDIKTVFTIHNLRYQGVFSKEVLTDVAGLPSYMMHHGGLEFFGDVNFMKSAINYSSAITTVSPSYAKEIKTPYFGEGLDGLLNEKQDKLYGILNGIDYDIFCPSKDNNLFKKYDINSLEKKVENKLQLQKILGLPQRKDVFMIGMVTRLVSQKGLDLVTHIMGELLERDIQFVVLGTGDDQYNSAFNYYSMTYPDKCAAKIMFDNTLAHRIYASSDIFLMPSLFEPCGIGQLIALRYGTLPLVRETGGLKDTVIPYNEKEKTGNGFSFSNYNAHEMLHIIDYAHSVFKDKASWKILMENAMKSDYSWESSAQQYKDLYRKLIEEIVL